MVIHCKREQEIYVKKKKYLCNPLQNKQKNIKTYRAIKS